ncbi:MAG: C39 family peptidase, partial [Spirochaetes bacterium]|nr:C39 family peptidase [Spirochaetota bacterium]
NTTLVVQRFVESTLENMLLAASGMWYGKGKGKSFGDMMVEQNWAKTQYTLIDYAQAKVSGYLKDIGQKQAQSARKAMEEMEKKEILLGLAWLGLRKAGSILGSAVDGIYELLDKGILTIGEVVGTIGQRIINWVQGEGLKTDQEILINKIIKLEETSKAVEEFGKQKVKEILQDFYKDSKEVTDAKIWALKQAGCDTTQLEEEIAKRRLAIEEKKKIELTDKKKNDEVVIINKAGIEPLINSILCMIGLVKDEKVIKGVKYYSQRDNETKDGIVNGNNMCNLTSLAMVMDHKGIDVKNGTKQYEDRLYEIAKIKNVGGKKLWYNTGIVYRTIFDYINENYNTNYIVEIKDANKYDFEKEVKKLIDQNKPVIVSGDFPNGHIVTIVGYDSNGWIVHDPYGNANTGYKDTNGEFVHYKYGKYSIGKKWFAYIR